MNRYQLEVAEMDRRRVVLMREVLTRTKATIASGGLRNASSEVARQSCGYADPCNAALVRSVHPQSTTSCGLPLNTR